MASFYAKEKSKYGTMSGSIIAWPIILDNNNPNSEENKKKLPAGYLKCDGTKYNADVYPELAAICGTGTESKFTQKDINGNPLQSVADNEFVVPDLGSKYPRSVPGADAGTYNNINVVTKSGVEKRRSGMGIDATSTVGSPIKITYTGKFVVPSQEINLKGKPSWTKGTNNTGLTDSESVDASSLHPHMHFSTTTRCRIKSSNSPESGQEAPFGLCAYNTASTIPIQNWLDATRINFSGAPGRKQPPCWAIASHAVAVSNYATNPDNVLGVNETIYHNMCFEGGSLTDFRYNCLLNVPVSYNIGSTNDALAGSPAAFQSWNIILGICFASNSGNIPLSGTAPATYISGGLGVPVDSSGVSLHDVLPLNSNTASTTGVAYPQVSNVLTEVEESIVPETGDPTIHSHKINLIKGDHNYKVKTDAFLLDPDALNTQLTISTDTAASIDSVTSPYIIIEYLIKI